MARLAAILARPIRPRYVPYALAFAAAAGAAAAWRLFRLRGAPPVLTADVKAFGCRFRFATARIRALGWTPRVDVGRGMDEAFADFASRRATASAGSRPAM